MKQHIFRITRDPTSLEEKLTAGFIATERDITSDHFPAVASPGPSPEEALVLNFGEYVFSEGVLSRMDQMGLRAGLPTELAHLSRRMAESTELAACLPRVALGDSWE